jgi:acetolactate decarboxylase
VTSHVIDDRLIGALHLRALDRQGFDHDRVAEHTAIQVGTLDAIMAGGYEGDATLAEVLRLGSLGIGTVQQLDGELVVLDGVPWVAAVDGSVRREALTTRTPFAVVVPFHPEAGEPLDGPLTLLEVTARADRLVGESVPVAAIRVDGTFRELQLRSVARQHPPYPRLAEVVTHQSTWDVAQSTGTLLGFRFPDGLAGLEVPGYHLHYLANDRTIGGHVLGATLVSGHLAVDHCEDLHVELPAGVGLGRPGAADRVEIARLEGGAG